MTDNNIDLRDYTYDEDATPMTVRLDAILHSIEFYEEKAQHYGYLPSNKHEVLLMLEEIKREVTKARKEAWLKK